MSYGRNYRTGMPDKGGGGTSTVYTDATLTGDGSVGSPLSVVPGSAEYTDLTSATSDYLLAKGETAIISYSGTGAFDVNLHVAVEEGEYEIILAGDQDATPSTGAIYLFPNNSSVAPGDVDITQVYQIYDPDADGSSTPTSGWGGTGATSITVGYGLNVRSHLKICTITKSKTVRLDNLRCTTANNYTWLMASINWLDTTTVWSSLGTISFPFSQSGTIYITRLGSIGSSGIGNIDGGHASAIYLPTQTLDGGGA